MASSVFKELCDRQYDLKRRDIARTAKDDPNLVQRLGLLKSYQVHHGCVNTICWNDNGNLILSGSDDQNLCVTNGFTYKEEFKYTTSHKANIFSAKFLPGSSDMQIVSCSGDGIVLHTDLSRQQESFNNQFNCHGGTTTYEVMTVPDSPDTFMSCGEDGTVRWFDLREKSNCSQQRCKDNILVSCQRAITALAINPSISYQLAVGCADSAVRIYDRRFLSVAAGEHLLARPLCNFVAPKLGEERYYRITSLNYDSLGEDMLVSYSSDYLYLFNIQKSKSTQLKRPARPKLSLWDQIKAARGKRERASPPPVRRLRLRGDWSDTGPHARPERDVANTSGLGQARPHLQTTLMQRMTDVLARMLNDPLTRAALSAGGEDSLREGGTAGLQEGAGGSMETDDGQAEGAVSNSEDSSSLQPQTSSSEPATPNQDSTSASAVTSTLHSHLATLRYLRQGFINEHGAEPSVSFRYSDQSTSSSTISLRANNAEEGEDNGRSERETGEGAASGGRTAKMDVDYAEVSNEDSDPQKTDEQIINMYEAELKRQYIGHRNARTMIKESTFWGSDYVMSGSDCGHVFVWNRHTAKLHMLLQADQHVVNCLRPHPTLPILATSGIDHDIKLWAPTLQTSGFDKEVADDLINRNAIMLEETRDTITVPAAFMIRMLACLNQIRRGGRRGRSRRAPFDDES